ncbi:HdaA/DnaA family protein [Azorhizobium doebereinerae]|uniref:HdaA/DnaA family protein n=1 Tax=Azorhizobium doebereinerae TaxID=281091 RepID=UPI0004192AA5|nr:chromosomal replication initiator protein DnaA [Azorhizobium doebereinerae]
MTGRDTKSRQLPLDLPAAAAMQREDFLGAPGNAAALTLVDSFPDWTARVVCLVGPAGTGKSHLARVFATRSGAVTVAARDLARAAVPEALAHGALVVEDLAPGDFDEAALFHLLNLAREQGAFVLMTARTPPAHWRLATPDLASRLRALPTVEIAAADDPLLAAVLVKLFADRQIPVDDATVQFLLRRMERTVEGAQQVVEALDRAALAAQRPVTRALAAQVLRDLLPGEGEPEDADD